MYSKQLWGQRGYLNDKEKSEKNNHMVEQGSLVDGDNSEKKERKKGLDKNLQMIGKMLRRGRRKVLDKTLRMMGEILRIGRRKIWINLRMLHLPFPKVLFVTLL